MIGKFVDELKLRGGIGQSGNRQNYGARDVLIGSGGIVGGDQVAKGPKDGYTLLMMSNAHAVSAAMYKTLPYDPVKDFAPVSALGTRRLKPSVYLMPMAQATSNSPATNRQKPAVTSGRPVR